MNQGNRPENPLLHAITGMLVRIVVSVVVIVAGVTVAAYFALGRPDAFFAGGAFPQLVSGARNVSAVVPTADAGLASILRVVVGGVVVVLVVLIGAIGIWDAWQSRHPRHGHSVPSESGQPDAHRRSSAAADHRRRAADMESLWSPEIAHMRTRHSERAPTDPDTLQGGTA